MNKRLLIIAAAAAAIFSIHSVALSGIFKTLLWAPTNYFLFIAAVCGAAPGMLLAMRPPLEKDKAQTLELLSTIAMFAGASLCLFALACVIVRVGQPSVGARQTLSLFVLWLLSFCSFLGLGMLLGAALLLTELSARAHLAATGLFFAIGFVVSSFLLDLFSGPGAIIFCSGCLFALGAVLVDRKTTALHFNLGAAAVFAVALILIFHLLFWFLRIQYAKGRPLPKPEAHSWSAQSHVLADISPQQTSPTVIINGKSALPKLRSLTVKNNPEKGVADVRGLPFDMIRPRRVCLVNDWWIDPPDATRVDLIDSNDVVRRLGRALVLQEQNRQSPIYRIYRANPYAFFAAAKEKYDLISINAPGMAPCDEAVFFFLPGAPIMTLHGVFAAMNRLSPRGGLVVEFPAQGRRSMLRFVVLAKQVLEARKAIHLENHFLIASDPRRALVLVSARPFTLSDTARILDLSKESQIELIYSPYFSNPAGQIADAVTAQDIDVFLSDNSLPAPNIVENHPAFFQSQKGWRKIQAAPPSIMPALKAPRLMLTLTLILCIVCLGATFLLPIAAYHKLDETMATHIAHLLFGALYAIGAAACLHSAAQVLRLFASHPEFCVVGAYPIFLLAFCIVVLFAQKLRLNAPPFRMKVLIVFVFAAALFYKVLGPSLLPLVFFSAPKAKALAFVLPLAAFAVLTCLPIAFTLTAAAQKGKIPFLWMSAVMAAAFLTGCALAARISLTFGYNAALITGLASLFGAVWIYKEP